MADTIVANIYITTDYSKFKRLKGNRAIDHSKKIIESIEAVGYVRSPILVNEKFEIIDGQNTFEALSVKGLPVEYMVQEGIGLRECQHLNIGQSNWSEMDWIVSYAENGSNDYTRLLEVLEMYPKLNIRQILAVVRKTTINGRVNEEIERGRLVFNELTLTEKTKLCWLEGMIPLIKKSGFTTKALIALGVFSSRGLIDETRMYEQFLNYGENDRFLTVPAKYWLEELQEIYNYNRKNKIYFLDEYKKISSEIIGKRKETARCKSISTQNKSTSSTTHH